MVREGIEFRLIVDEESEGQLNMAIDEALLESVSSGESAPVIRLYGFSPPTLSVGRFQPTTDVVNFQRVVAEGVTFVRRPSGGQSVLHTEELTYAFIMGKKHLDPFGKRWVYRFIAPLLMAGLTRLGVPDVRSNPAQKGSPTNPDCFGSTGEYEIDSRGGRKMVGSAQMITRSAVLQHGSIPLTAKGREIAHFLREGDVTEDHATNIHDETGRSFGYFEVRDTFASALRERISARFDRMRPVELTRAMDLLRKKYSTDAWNRKY